MQKIKKHAINLIGDQGIFAKLTYLSLKLFEYGEFIKVNDKFRLIYRIDRYKLN